jgi:hypothetical protein
MTERKYPFYVGQTADNVLAVTKRTNRKRKVLVVIDAHGEHRLDFTKKRERKHETEAWMREKIELSSVSCVTEVYDECTLVFKRSRGPTKKGALCFRVEKILPRGPIESIDGQACVEDATIA